MFVLKDRDYLAYLQIFVGFTDSERHPVFSRYQPQNKI